jgi:glycosyltransferase involved in cell wall biosynthesis
VRSIDPPEVSVFIQTYQHADFIHESVESVLAQRTDFDVEIVIADDFSTDGTRETLLHCQRRHPDRIRLLLPECNLGANELFRRGVAELSGRYVAWLDGDDLWTDEDKLSLQVEALREHPDWAACFHDATVVDGAERRSYVPDLEGDSLSFADLLRRNYVPALSVMARGDLVRSLPEWVLQGLWSDWLALLAIARSGEIGYLRRTMGAYRVHGGGISAGLSRAEQLEEDLRFFQLVAEAVGEEHGLEIEGYVRERHVQLVAERQLPFDGAVAMLGPPEDTPSYLNGRHVWPLAAGLSSAELDRRDRNGALATELERMRRGAGDVEPAKPHFPGADGAPLHSRDATLNLVVVGSAVTWLDRYSRLGRQLEGASTVVWRDEECVVLEVEAPPGAPAPMGALIETADVKLLPGPAGLFGCHIDAPTVGRVGDANAFEIAGWVVGDQVPVVAVELATDGAAFRRVPVGAPRPDLENAFPDKPGVGAAGFSTSISLVGTEAETEIDVRAILRDQTRVPFGSIRARRRWRERVDEKSKPLISVVIPCYGQAGYLDDAIESVLAQTYTQVEIVVVDDGSPDNASRIAQRHPGVRCVRQENRGLAAARNSGIRESEGELLVFLDADDRLMPRALELGVEELRRHPEAAFAFGRYRKIAADGSDVAGDVQPRPDESPYAVFLRYNYAGIPATGIYRRSALEQVGNFDETAPGAEDYALGLRLAREFPVRPHEAYVAEYRQHGGGMSRETATMLTMTQRVLRSQRRHVRRDRSLRESYRAGRRFWREYYGVPLAAQVREDFANHEWRNGLRGVGSLIRRDPRRLWGLLRPPRAG